MKFLCLLVVLLLFFHKQGIKADIILSLLFILFFFLETRDHADAFESLVLLCLYVFISTFLLREIRRAIFKTLKP